MSSPGIAGKLVSMSVAMWNEIKQINGARTARLPLGHQEVVLLPVPALSLLPGPAYWLVGEFNHLSNFATSLRTRQEARQFFVDQNVRVGLRAEDHPPLNRTRQRGYGDTIPGAGVGQNFAPQRVQARSQAVNVAVPAPGNRLADNEENVRTYWAQQTAQAHHIVEFNHLRDTGASHDGSAGSLDYGRLPCILLAAEFHQRYISSILKPEHGREAAYLRGNMPRIYNGIYLGKCPPLSPLWQVSQAILRAANLLLPPSGPAGGAAAAATGARSAGNGR